MESLLPEIAEKVAKYLSPRDLTACCAVSVHWRDIFGTNKVWKPLCVVDIEEYLRTTPCLVEPAFAMCLDQDSTLTPLSQWRLAFLREQHLWRNWREGNSETVKLNLTSRGENAISLPIKYTSRFVSNDFVIIFKLFSVELWNVRSLNPELVDTLKLFDRAQEYYPSVFENGLVFVQNSVPNERRFIVLKVDIIEGTISVINQFIFNKITHTPELVICREISSVVAQDLDSDDFNVIIKRGRFCIGFYPQRAGNTFDVWDLETVAKPKQESFPNASASNRLIALDFESCDDVLMLASSVPLDYDSRINVPLLCRVYDVQSLGFFAFSTSFLVNIEKIVDDAIPVAVTNNLMALADCGTDTPCSGIKTVRIFNYRIDQQLYLFEANDLLGVLGEECFLFTCANLEVDGSSGLRICTVFCSSGDFVKDVTGLDVEDIRCIGDRFIEVFKSNDASEVWGITRFSMFKTAVKFVRPDPWEVFFLGGSLRPVNGSNSACTKLIAQKRISEGNVFFDYVDVLEISHFW